MPMSLIEQAIKMQQAQQGGPFASLLNGSQAGAPQPGGPSLIAPQAVQQQAQPQPGFANASPGGQRKPNIADKFANLLQNPLFQTGASLLATGDVGQGLLQAGQLQAQQRNSLLERAQAERQAEQEARQQQFDNQLAVERLTPGTARLAEIVADPNTPPEIRDLIKQSLLRPQSSVDINLQPDGTMAPVRRPEPTVSTPEFDVIQKATGPVDTFLRVAQRLPLIAPILGEAGTEQRQSRLIIESINNDLRRAFAINSSRISNFDLSRAERLLPASLGVFTSEQGAVSDLVQLQKLIDEDIAQNLEASRSQFLTDSDRSEAQQIVNALSSASDRIGGILTARQLAVTKIGGKPIGDLSPQELESLDPSNLTDEQLQAVVAARRLANGR